MTAQDVIDKGTALKNLISQMDRLATLILNPSVEGVDVSSSDFTTRYNALKADIEAGWTDYETAIDGYTP